MPTAAAFVAVLLVLGAASPAAAVTWNLTQAVPAGLQTWRGYPPDHPECTVTGVCNAYTTTIPAKTLWYWCGWTTKDRTEYFIKSTGANITAVMMREKDVNGCALKKLSGIKKCQQLDNTLCDTKTKCNFLVVGMTFVDDSCLLVANNDVVDATVSIQVWQYYDRARYIGTIFAALTFIVMMSLAVAWVAWTIHHGLTRPLSRVAELHRLKEEQQNPKVHAGATGFKASFTNLIKRFKQN